MRIVIQELIDIRDQIIKSDRFSYDKIIEFIEIHSIFYIFIQIQKGLHH